MRLHSGTSGFSYAAWKGSFYPEKARSKDFLALFAQKLGCVEINNTFYRMPEAAQVHGWTETVGPRDFKFALKAPQRITHHLRLVEVGDTVDELWQLAQQLGAHLGPVLFQLPPNFVSDLPRLTGFLDSLPIGMRTVVEFRHRSWFDEPTLEALRARNVALCYADVDPKSAEDTGLGQRFESTSDFGYVRLRREKYSQASLRAWASRIREQAWKEVFVFFKHEVTAPKYALALRSIWNKPPRSVKVT